MVQGTNFPPIWTKCFTNNGAKWIWNWVEDYIRKVNSETMKHES